MSFVDNYFATCSGTSNLGVSFVDKYFATCSGTSNLGVSFVDNYFATCSGTSKLLAPLKLQDCTKVWTGSQQNWEKRSKQKQLLFLYCKLSCWLVQ